MEMERHHYESKIFTALGIIILIVGIFYLSTLKNPRTTPTQVFTPSSYPAGTTVALYSAAPIDFPKEVVLENKPFNNISSVNSPDGHKQITLSYISDMTTQDLAALYNKGLPNVGWTPNPVYLPHGNVVFNAKNGEKTVLITITAAANSKSMVTFQYQE